MTRIIIYFAIIKIKFKICDLKSNIHYKTEKTNQLKFVINIQIEFQSFAKRQREAMFQKSIKKSI